MKRLKLIICLVIPIVFSSTLYAQKIVYSTTHNEPANDVNFEILGKIGSNYIVFKNINWRNLFQVFDQDMKEISNERIKFLPEKLINADFVSYPDHFIMIYQYKRNGILYCDAVDMDANANPIGDILTVDTTRIGMQSGSDVYSTIYSEDKSNILVYKMHEKNNKVNIVTKRFSAKLRLLDSTRSVIAFDDRREIYSPFQLANDGTIFFTKETKEGNRENIAQLEVVTSKPASNTFVAVPINLQKKYIDGVQIKIDNLNNNYLINSFYYSEKRGGAVEGLFSAIMNRDTDSVKVVFNILNDNLRQALAGSGNFRNAFDNLFLRNTLVKRNGSYVLVAEEFSSQSMGNPNSWNRWDYLYGNPYSYYNDYYYWNSPYYRYNRFDNYNTNRSTRYFYNNIFVLSLDSALNIEWGNVILKNQSNDNDDSYLSFGLMNSGPELNFLYIEKERNAQIVSNQSVSTYGKLYRYPTLKTRESGYQFMPRLAKQVGQRRLIVPVVKRGNLGFAKLDF